MFILNFPGVTFHFEIVAEVRLKSALQPGSRVLRSSNEPQQMKSTQLSKQRRCCDSIISLVRRVIPASEMLSDFRARLLADSFSAALRSTLGLTFEREQVLFTVTQNTHLMKRKRIHPRQLMRATHRRHFPIKFEYCR